MSEVEQFLRGARTLIATEKTWTRHAMARDGFLLVVDSLSPRARCFCSIGALNRHQLDSGRPSDVEIAAFKALSEVMPGGVVRFNDKHSHAEVLAKWDEAIALAAKDRRYSHV